MRATIKEGSPHKVFVSKPWKGATVHILMLENGAELGSQLRKAAICGRTPPVSENWEVLQNPSPSNICKQCSRLDRKREENE